MARMRREGRPLKFQTVEEMQSRIELYFNDCPREEWTITGLALALDTDRATLINYENRDEFFNTLKKAKEMVHNAYELDLRKKGRSGDIFALKNFGWTDRQETDLTTKGESLNKDITDDEFKKLMKTYTHKNETDTGTEALGAEEEGVS